MAIETVTPGSGDALILVDVQNDFLPGGSLAVPRGDEVIAPLNRYIDAFRQRGLTVVATRDWHTPDHCSFNEQGGIWPVHCVADTTGAAFAADLQLPPMALIVSKASSRERDAYSGFEGTDLATELRRRGIRRLFVGGLATDYCVLNTVLDGLREHFTVYLLEDAIRAVNLNPADGRQAIANMHQHGARPLTLATLSDQNPGHNSC